MAGWEIRQGDCVEALETLPEAAAAAIVTDPPYGIGFMGHEWDQPTIAPTKNGHVRGGGKRATANAIAGTYDQSSAGHRRFQAWAEEWGRAALHALVPGGHVLAFGGTRTYHRLVAGLEDAGFEIRDQLAWIFATGFPKSRDVGREIDDRLGAERQPASFERQHNRGRTTGKEALGDYAGEWALTEPATDEAREWDGWGTALKPAHEPIVVARKPLDGTIAANVLEHHAGGLNIAAGEVEGRWPPNVALGHHEDCGDRCVPGCPVDMLARQQRERFFFCAKPSIREREAGLAQLPAAQQDPGRKQGRAGGDNPRNRGARPRHNPHPTVKPVALMRWLVRMVVPRGHLCLDPFCGSGTTGIACALDGLDFLGIERDAAYVDVARARVAAWEAHAADPAAA